MKKLSEREKRWIERTVANNRNYKLYLYNRVGIILFLVLFQLAGYIWLLYLFAHNSVIGLSVQIAVEAIALLAVLHLINQSERPSLKMNWILLILLVPIIGVSMYLMYGDGKPTKRLRKRLSNAKDKNKEAFKSAFGEIGLPNVQTRGEAISRYLAKYADYPLYQNGIVTYYKSGEETFSAMLEALRKAEKFILLEYFIIEHGKMWGEILKILLEKAELGVQVRIIYDDMGCIVTLPPRYDKYLESLHKNIKCMRFNRVVPVLALRMNNRDHRKMMVVDGKVAFTGGINLADEYIGVKKRFGYWKDAGLKIEGEAVHSFSRMFFDFWNAFRQDEEPLENYLIKKNDGGRYALNEKMRVQPYDDSPLDKIRVGEAVYTDIVNGATKYVYIFTPYLVLDDALRAALAQASMRGVDVRIVTPGIPDKKAVFRLTRANYPLLIKAGVKIYEYTPGFIHSKCIVSDDDCAVVGTVNFDYRSLYHHFENAVYFSGAEAVLDVKRDCEETFALSKLCTQQDLKRNVVGRWVDALLRVFETLF